MDKRMLAPREVANVLVSTNIKRAEFSSKECVLLGILAGVFIGFGGLGNILVTQTLGGVDAGLARFLGAMVFPVGLMLVVMCGAELFTGNNLMTLAVMDKKITMKPVLRNWSIVYLANFLGSLLLVIIVFYSGTLSGDGANRAIAIAESKANLPAMQAFLRAILCNIMVVLAVWMATAAKDVISKIFACWFPIMLFVLCGFEHSIANMFFIPMGMILGAQITLSQLAYNLIIVTIGNIVGGAIIVPWMYYQCYLKKDHHNKVEN